MISLTIYEIIDTSMREVQALIVFPTRELATQTKKVILSIRDFMNVQDHVCIGGKNIGDNNFIQVLLLISGSNYHGHFEWQ
jgi:ATP-dependent RNA helicase